MKTVVWEIFDKEQMSSKDTESLFVEKAFRELEIPTTHKNVVILLETSKFNLAIKDYIINLIEALLSQIKYSDTTILLSSKNELIDTKIFGDEVRVVITPYDGFEEIERKRKIEKLNDYKSIKPFFLSKHYLPRSLIEADSIIPINLFDTSSVFHIKGVVASFFCFLPTYVKSEILIKNTELERAKALLEIFSEINSKIVLAFNNMLSEEKVFFVASNDVISTDAFASALSGIKALSVPTTKIANKMKIGAGDITRLRVVGERFTKPILFLERKRVGTEIKIDIEKCNLCMKCINVCPLLAILLKEGIFEINHNLCNKCLYCAEICPLNAIS